MSVRGWKFALLLPVIVVLAACDPTGPGGEARVFLAKSVSPSAGTVQGSDFISEAGPLTLAAVDSLWVTVTGVEVVPSGADSAGGWQSLKLDSGSVSRINLLALPGEGADSTRIAIGEVQAGEYSHIRLRINDSATIVLKQDVVLPQGNTLAKGSYPVRIPSGQQTGLKIKTTGFEVAEGSTEAVTLVFEGSSTLGNLIVTGNGVLQMSPVLRARNP
jgi:hypothetical protein